MKYAKKALCGLLLATNFYSSLMCEVGEFGSISGLKNLDQDVRKLQSDIEPYVRRLAILNEEAHQASSDSKRSQKIR